MKTSPYLVYVGTYNRTGNTEKDRLGGLCIFRFDPADGSLEQAGIEKKMINPSFLCTDSRNRYLYAVSEVTEYESQSGGAVSAYAINRQTGRLELLNTRTTRGAHPCHLNIDRTGKWLCAANYTGGSLAVFPLQKDGRLGEMSAFIQHSGSGPNAQRQESAHVHSTVTDPTNRYLLAADLGLDRITIYELDSTTGSLKPHRIPWISVKPGAGPRHMTFHPNGVFFYITNELDSTVKAFQYDKTSGTLKEIQTLPLLPQDFTGTNTSADIHITPSGKFLYASNRGHDSLAVFSIEPATGKLTSVGHVPSLGCTPRNFVIDPSGTFLLVANQDSDTIITFRIDPQTGLLSLAGQPISVPSPVCILFGSQGQTLRTMTLMTKPSDGTQWNL